MRHRSSSRLAVVLALLTTQVACGAKKATASRVAPDGGATPDDDGGAPISAGDAGDAGDGAPPTCGTDCAGLACGTPCTSVFTDGNPVSTCDGFTLTGFCDGMGSCSASANSSTPPACVTAACSGMTCGDSCELAGAAGNCDDQGLCRTDAFPTCTGWNPCGGKACGAACDLCPPGTTCTPHPGLCIATGACIQNLPPGCHECTQASDCTAVPTLYCTTGAQVSIPPTCTAAMTCDYTTPTTADCGPPMCDAWDTSHTPATPSCTNDFGWQWDGSSCEDIVGCLFEGNGQTSGFPSESVCEQAMAPCMQ